MGVLPYNPIGREFAPFDAADCSFTTVAENGIIMIVNWFIGKKIGDGRAAAGSGMQ
jgi:hypothetical protein